MTKIYNTWVLPSKKRVEDILNSIEPELSETQMEEAWQLIRQFELLLKSGSFSLNSDGKQYLDFTFMLDICGHRISKSCLSSCASVSFSSETNISLNVINQIGALYWNEIFSSLFNEQLDADCIIKEFTKERIEEQWPTARQREITESLLDEIYKLSSGEIKANEMFKHIPKEPTDEFCARFAGW